MDHITVRHEAGDRFRVSVRGHDLIVDQPGSGDAGPTPTELFVASLTACAGFYARRFLARHGVADGDLTVEAEFVWSADHARVAGIRLRIASRAGIAPELLAALARVVDKCTVHESIRIAPDIAFEIVTTGAPVPA